MFRYPAVLLSALPLSLSLLCLARWLANAASTKVINDLPKFIQAMEEQSSRGKAKCVFVAFVPPPKKDLPRYQLDTQFLRKNKMSVKTTFAWSGDMVSGRPMLRRHPLGGYPADRSLRPVWEAVEEEEGPDWREAYRSLQPEIAAPALKGLKNQWDMNKRSIQVELPARRVPWSERVQNFLKRKSST